MGALSKERGRVAVKRLGNGSATQRRDWIGRARFAGRSLAGALLMLIRRDLLSDKRHRLIYN